MVLTLILISGFVFLIKGADLLVDGASSLARRLRVTDLVIGLTVVAFGTSAPELLINIVASVRGKGGIVLGNILGSNTVNILLILGLSAVIFPLLVSHSTVWKEIPLSLLAAVLVFVMANDRMIDQAAVSVLTRIDGIVLVTFFVIFLYYSMSIAQVSQEGTPLRRVPQLRLAQSILWVVLGLGALVLGGHLVVEGAIQLARKLGLSELMIGLTIVAVGTSLPELATSTMAAWKKNPDIAVGNIVGSNIFNIFLILGISAIINPLPFNPENNIDVVVTIMASLILFLCMFTGRRQVIERWKGFLFIGIYICYIIYLIGRG